jgi:superfamily II DNA helicase RecQ
MARKKPVSLESFLEVKRVGEKKYKKYGERFIAVITIGFSVCLQSH